MIRVAITDDHPLIIDGLLNALSDAQEIKIVGTYANGAAMIQGLKENPADVLLLDLQLPDRNGSELVPVVLQQRPEIHI